VADDIRFSVNFWQHPKTIKLTRKGGLEAVRSLQILWCFCAQERTTGILDGMDVDDIEIAADWRGEPGLLVELLLSGNWLEQLQDGTYALHGWEERQAYVSKKELRKAQARDAAEKRWKKMRGVQSAMPDDAMSNADGMRAASEAHANSNADLCEQHCPQHEAAMLDHAQRNAPLPLPDPDPKGINTPPLPPTGGNAVGETEQIPPQPIPEQPDVPEGASKPERRKRDPTGNTLPELRQTIAKFTAHEPLRKALEDFRVMRERIRKPLTGRGLELLFGKLHELAPGNEAMQVAIVEQSTMNGWQGIFPVNGPMRTDHAVGQLMGKNAQTMAAVLAARQKGRAGNERV